MRQTLHPRYRKKVWYRLRARSDRWEGRKLLPLSRKVVGAVAWLGVAPG
jgi:hypothetical protein